MHSQIEVCVSSICLLVTCREKIMVQCICLILLLNQLEIIILSNKLYDIEISIVNSSVLTQFSSHRYMLGLKKNWTSYIICFTSMRPPYPTIKFLLIFIIN